MLTPREFQALSLIAKGCTDRDISTQLCVSLSTARKHREHLHDKLSLNKSAQLAIYYLENFAALEPTNKAQLQSTKLSERELQIVQLFAQGMSDKEVARELAISDLTVRKHRGNMQDKLAASNICGLLYALVARGWLELPLKGQANTG
ncbi:response regulator transcription factor [Pseudomonas leptonychotis]|uniref:response regulator transcription factor n=1 Tax=Pseudomonas leptonychotis TaxID=2448482 RepID=UPI00386B5AEE